MSIVGGTMNSIYETMSIVGGTMSSIYGTLRINVGTMSFGHEWWKLEQNSSKMSILGVEP